MSEIGGSGRQQTPEAEQEPTGYIRLPLPIAALGALVVLGVLLAIGLYANANLRSPGLIVPTPATAVAAATTPAATLAPAATATPAGRNAPTTLAVRSPPPGGCRRPATGHRCPPRT